MPTNFTSVSDALAELTDIELRALIVAVNEARRRSRTACLYGLKAPAIARRVAQVANPNPDTDYRNLCARSPRRSTDRRTFRRSDHYQIWRGV
jgi:hypothetical protein